MKVIKALSKPMLLASTILLSQSALAFLQFTYTSNPLPFIEGYLGGNVDETVGSADAPPSFFTISFSSVGNNSIVNLLAGDLSVGSPDYLTRLENVPASNSSITLNTDGSIAAWDFSFFVEKRSPENSIEEPNHSSWYLESHYGINSCNCDTYKEESDIFIQRQDQFQYINTLGFLYADNNSLTNWTIEKIEVPEPKSYILFLIGLLAICVARLQATKKIS